MVVLESRTFGNLLIIIRLARNVANTTIRLEGITTINHSMVNDCIAFRVKLIVAPSGACCGLNSRPHAGYRRTIAFCSQLLICLLEGFAA